MQTRLQLRTNSWAKLRSAQAVLDKREFDTAIYLCGIAVELALKARICVDQNLKGWPETEAEFKAVRPLKLKNHDLRELLDLTNQAAHMSKQCFSEWGTCLQWSIDMRYQAPGTAKRASVEEMMRAAEVVIRELSRNPGMEAISVNPTALPFVKLWALAHEIQIERGEFYLFALVHRTGDPETAELVVSAHWLDAHTRSGAKYISDRVTSTLNDEELMAVSALIVLDPKHEFVARLSSALTITGGQVWFENSLTNVQGVEIGKALVVICRRLEH